MKVKLLKKVRRNFKICDFINDHKIQIVDENFRERYTNDFRHPYKYTVHYSSEEERVYYINKAKESIIWHLRYTYPKLGHYNKSKNSFIHIK